MLPPVIGAYSVETFVSSVDAHGERGESFDLIHRMDLPSYRMALGLRGALSLF